KRARRRPAPDALCDLAFGDCIPVLRAFIPLHHIHRVPVNQLRLVSLEGNLSPDSFEVEKIIDHRGCPKSREYLVKWRNFSKEHNSWESASNFDTLGCVADYWRARTAKKVEGISSQPTPAAPRPAETSRSSPRSRSRRVEAQHAKNPPTAVIGDRVHEAAPIKATP
ncbi:MAG: hypothetical protein AN485_24265, partial [Anabaena sp. MDT14b]